MLCRIWCEGHHDRFQTAVSQALSDFRNDEPAPARSGRAAPKDDSERGTAKPARPAGRHPGGERQSKRQNALAENLKRWMAGRSGGTGDN